LAFALNGLFYLVIIGVIVLMPTLSTSVHGSAKAADVRAADQR
jgi:hypothetical protein